MPEPEPINGRGGAAGRLLSSNRNPAFRRWLEEYRRKLEGVSASTHRPAPHPSLRK
jgi:hypothetical protein